ncbi:MAG: hypothetical protein ABFD04_04035, partial [Syntrophomonas sp.]
VLTIVGAAFMPLQRTGVIVSLAFILLIAVASQLRYLELKPGWSTLVPARKMLPEKRSGREDEE